MSYWLLYFFCMLIGAGRVVPAKPGGMFHSLNCLACGYSLANRRPDETCPECGRRGAGVGFREKRAELRIREERRLLCIGWSGLLAILCIIAEVVAPYIVAISYRIQGFSWSSGVRAAESREFGESYRWGVWLPGLPGSLRMDALSGVLIAVAMVPILWRMPKRGARIGLTALIILVGVVHTIWRWTVPYMVHRVY